MATATQLCCDFARYNGITIFCGIIATQIEISYRHRPGDHVLWTSDDQRLPAVVQSVDAPQRTARIMFSDSGVHEVASVLELDAHGISDTATASADDLGVRRGDYVFILPEGVTTGFEPWIPHIGEVEHWVHETVFPHSQLTGWRKEMADIGTHIASHRDSDGFVDGQFSDDTSSILWIGEVTDVCPLMVQYFF